MRPELLRAILQGIFLLLFMPVLFFFGAGCFCGGCGVPTGGDQGGPQPEIAVQTRETLVGDGVVSRYHLVQDGQLIASAGEAQVFKQGLPDAFVGLLLPSAPGASQPGQLQDGANVMQGTVATPVPLRQDRTQAARLTQLFPPAPGTQWAALVVSDTQMLDSLLSGPINLNSIIASFNYAIDFGGTNPCNGCEVQVVGCVPGQFAAFLPPGLVTVRTAGQGAAALPLACTQPVSTYITLYDYLGQPLPDAPLVAAFGLWGSLPTTSTINGAVILPLNLEHTGQTTLTFGLAPIQSALGWTYNWADSQGAAITQIAVPRRTQYASPPPQNLRVTATGLPTCTQVVDVLTLRAMNTVTSSLQAQTSASVVVLPDPANCPVADVAAHHVQATAVISGGDRLTYTLTISNLTNADVPGVITQTLSPGAVRGADLPGGCTIAGNVVTCQVGDVPAQGAKAVTVVILGTPGYSGDLNSTIEVNPTGKSDLAFLDNVHGPLVAAVNFAVPSFPLTVTKSGTGSGVVTSVPAGIDCGADCGESYLAGTVVTLTAAAASGSTFVDWQGACTSANPVCPVTMDAAKVTTATFALVPVNHLLTVAKRGAGSGVVTSVPAGIDCGADCGESYLAGTVVTLTVAAASGSTFVDWQGACTGANPVCSVTMDAAQVTTATFALVPVSHPLSVTKSGAGTGVVTSAPAGIDWAPTAGRAILPARWSR